MDADGGRAAVVGRFRADPHPALRPFVVEYWGLARDLAAMGGFTITPDCHGELICCADAMFVVDGDRKERLPPCFLIGLLDRPLRIESPGIVRCMAARLRAWSIGPLLANRTDRPPRGWEDATDVFGPWLRPARDRVERCDWPRLKEIYDELLLDELGRWEPAMTGLRTIERLLDGEASCQTAIVAGERRVSTRQVERRVRMLTRSSPKQLACLSRFQKVRDALWADPSADLARLAVAAGYADQPHMTRHFKRYAGETPARFARGAMAMKSWLATDDVAFVQEGATGGE